MKREETACVYIIDNLELSRVKIGYATNVRTRFSCIRSQSGCEMRLFYHTKPIYNYKNIEAKMHSLFSEFRGIGEWFDIKPEDAKKELIKMENEFNQCEIVGMYLDGLNPTKIAENVGLSRSAVVKYLLTTEIYHNRESKKEWESKRKKNVNTFKSVNSSISKTALERMVERNNEKRKKRKKAHRLR